MTDEIGRESRNVLDIETFLICAVLSILSHAVGWFVTQNARGTELLEYAGIAAAATSEIDDGRIARITDNVLNSRCFEILSERPFEHVLI
ncbi:hypothetical protein XM57_14400 [Burkholderia cepacia]|nr:hypothetical protein XM57_14400 [Burkholderia cepacia]ETP66857.1 hypothetical protein BDSB_10820 [Burkholderia dolosa PC543]